MVPGMRETMPLEGSTELELINGMMGLNILGIGRKTKSLALGFTPGSMGESMKENGKIIIWKE